jgi:large subunit ribosomal protein L6
MSRIGKQPIPLPEGVEVTLRKTEITVQGPHGSVSAIVHPDIEVVEEKEPRELRVARPSDSKHHRSLHGLTRSLIASAVQGVSQPFVKTLEIKGVGYTAKMQGTKLTLQIGFCHPVDFDVPDTLTVETPTNQRIVVQGCDKQQVGQFAANVRRVRPPEPYNGKGIRYLDERVIRKAGKSFVSGEK